MNSPFRPSHQPAQMLYDALVSEQSKRSSRSVEDWLKAERDAMWSTARDYAQKHGLRIPLLSEIEAKEQLATGHSDYASIWASGVAQLLTDDTRRRRDLSAQSQPASSTPQRLPVTMNSSSVFDGISPNEALQVRLSEMTAHEMRLPQIPVCRTPAKMFCDRSTRSGLYVASRASIPARSAMWRELRADGWPIVSSWIDSTGAHDPEGDDLTVLWRTIEQDISRCAGVILYAEVGDFPLKGALIECGMAIGQGLPVAIVLPDVGVDPASMAPLGSWVWHPSVRRFDNVADARQWLEADQPTSSAEVAAAPLMRQIEYSRFEFPMGWGEVGAVFVRARVYGDGTTAFFFAPSENPGKTSITSSIETLFSTVIVRLIEDGNLPPIDHPTAQLTPKDFATFARRSVIIQYEPEGAGGSGSHARVGFDEMLNPFWSYLSSEALLQIPGVDNALLDPRPAHQGSPASGESDL